MERLKSKTIFGVKELELDIDPAFTSTLWYENEDGVRWIPPQEPYNCPPEGYIYQHFHEVRTTETRILNIETGKSVCSFRSTYPSDLFIALVQKGGYSSAKAQVIASQACERCMNVMANFYKLGWGYEIGSEDWKKANTRCYFCHEYSEVEDELRGESGVCNLFDNFGTPPETGEGISEQSDLPCTGSDAPTGVPNPESLVSDPNYHGAR